MKGFIGLTKRNIQIYFKDVHTVIFSMLTSIIVFVLYLLFLKGTFLEAIEGSMQGLEAFINADDVKMFRNHHNSLQLLNNNRKRPRKKS